MSMSVAGDGFPLRPQPVGWASTGQKAAEPGTACWGADRAVTMMYREHYRSLVRFASLLVADVGTAEDVVQDSFIAMHHAWRRLRNADKGLSYLRRCVVNRSRSVLRHRGVVERALPQLVPDMPSAEHSVFASLERSQVVAALAMLPTRQREVLVLKFYADLREWEIAEALGISLGSVKSHSFRAMAALRAVLTAD
jgi:RNA polymerase sigma-70 factor (sigma-E family)